MEQHRSGDERLGERIPEQSARGQVQSKTWRMMSALEHPQVLDCACPLALCIVLELTATPLVTMSSLTDVTDACSFKFRRDMVWFDHEPEPG